MIKNILMMLILLSQIRVWNASQDIIVKDYVATIKQDIIVKDYVADDITIKQDQPDIIWTKGKNGAWDIVIKLNNIKYQYPQYKFKSCYLILKADNGWKKGHADIAKIKVTQSKIYSHQGTWNYFQPFSKTIYQDKASTSFYTHANIARARFPRFNVNITNLCEQMLERNSMMAILLQVENKCNVTDCNYKIAFYSIREKNYFKPYFSWHFQRPICDNGEVEGTEECDQGNSLTSGCLNCKVQKHYQCVGQPSRCTCIEGYKQNNKSQCIEHIYCGNGKIQGAEECDSGKNQEYGCLNCTVQKNYQCKGQPSQCKCITGYKQKNEEKCVVDTLAQTIIISVVAVIMVIVLRMYFSIRSKQQQQQNEFGDLQGWNLKLKKLQDEYEELLQSYVDEN